MTKARLNSKFGWASLVVACVLAGRLVVTVAGAAAAPALAQTNSATIFAKEAVPIPARVVTTSSAGIDELLEMLDAKMEPAVILAYITNSPTPFNPKASEMILLRERGLPTEAMTALLRRGGEVRRQAAATAYASYVREHGKDSAYADYVYLNYPYCAYPYPYYGRWSSDWDRPWLFFDIGWGPGWGPGPPPPHGPGPGPGPGPGGPGPGGGMPPGGHGPPGGGGGHGPGGGGGGRPGGHR